ncbi:MAG: hypothetical protein LKE88_06920 [Acidaminococcus provencensis]|jgi:hypothetical protein|uniref:hypothetical protein n=1 Tax=Acidaminococcus provencensis TaxID=2058289 RepID=UPI0023F16C0C|nr:hypothetical protein [Acidaminococcus provencensis]MCH4096361.1 hypothetical protein [Acidaminococcus provencensis]
MDRGKELARLRAMDAEQKARVLGHLETALAAADVHVFLSYEPHTETVHIKFTRYSPKPEIVVNVHMDNAAAMLYDIFKQAGPELVAEA